MISSLVPNRVLVLQCFIGFSCQHTILSDNLNLAIYIVVEINWLINYAEIPFRSSGFSLYFYWIGQIWILTGPQCFLGGSGVGGGGGTPPEHFWKLDAKSCILAYSEHKILYMKKTQFLPFFYEIHVLYVSLYQKTYISLQSLAQYTIQGQTLWGKNKNYKKVEWKRLINFFLPNKIWKQNDLRKDHVLMHQWNILKTSYITKNVSGKTWCVKSPYLISIWRGSLGCQVQMF